MDKNYLLLMYNRGDDLENMMYELDASKEEIYSTLKSYKEECTINRRLNDEIKEMIVQRFVNSDGEISPFMLDQELGMGTMSAKRILKSAGVIDNSYKRVNNSEKEYNVINHDDQCPDCQSDRVKSVSTEIKNSYCRDCGTEWYEVVNKGVSEVRRVLFYELA